MTWTNTLFLSQERWGEALQLDWEQTHELNLFSCDSSVFPATSTFHGEDQTENH